MLRYHVRWVFLILEMTEYRDSEYTRDEIKVTSLKRRDASATKGQFAITRGRARSVRGVLDKKHVLSRKTGRTRIVYIYAPVTRVMCHRARTSQGDVRGACVAYTEVVVRNFRPTYTRVIYYVARVEHISHLHIA